MTTVASLSLIILAALLLLQGFLVYRKRAIGSLFLWSRIFTILASGFLAAFLLHFLMFDDPATSWRYLLYDTKMVFLRKGYYNLGNPEYAKALNWYFTFKPTALVAYHPAIFIAHGAALLLLAVGYLRRWVQITFLQLGLCIALTLICVANLALGVRFILRDLLWAETLMNFLTLLYLSLLISRTRRFGRGVHILAGLGIAAIVLSNLIHLAAMPARINANYNRFSWEPMYFTKHVFPGNQSLYTNIIDRRYTPRETIPVALHQATDAARIRSIASFVFPNQCVSLRSIGIVSEFFPAWAADPTFRIESFTPELRGSIVVDNCKLPLQPNGRLIPVWVREHSEYLDKFQKDASAGNLAILTRNDLQILLFSPEGQPPPNIDNQITRTDLKIRLSNGQNSMVMRGYRIDNYVELPQQSLSPRSFFVIRTR